MSISGGRPDRPAMADFEVHIDLNGRIRQIGRAVDAHGRLARGLNRTGHVLGWNREVRAFATGCRVPTAGASKGEA